MSAAEGHHILVVDDDRLVLTTLAEGLRSAGYEVTRAGSGEEALELLERHDTREADLALLDVRMPGISGLELARRLQARRTLPFLFLSAFDDRAMVREAVEHGALGYLVKPLVVQQIVPTLEAALARGRELRALRSAHEEARAAAAERQTVSIAVGLLMERNGIDRERAFRVLRARARTQRRKLHEIASELLDAASLLTLSETERARA